MEQANMSRNINVSRISNGSNTGLVAVGIARITEAARCEDRLQRDVCQLPMRRRARVLSFIVIAAIFSLGSLAGRAETNPPASNDKNVSNGPEASSVPGFTDQASWHKTMAAQPVAKAGCFTATYPSPNWVEVPCATGRPAAPFSPQFQPFLAGNGADSVAQSGRTISSVTGSFPNVSGLVSEYDTRQGPNAFSLQINSNNNFPTPLCTFTFFFSTVSVCKGWQQFVYSTNSNGAIVTIENWLVDVPSWMPCPGGWQRSSIPAGSPGAGPGCTMFSSILQVPSVGIADLTNLQLEGQVNVNGYDEAIVWIAGKPWMSTQPSSTLNLYQSWNGAEFNVFGDGGAASAIFNPGTSITVAMTVFDGAGSNPLTCMPGGTTAETNNLTLSAGCCPSGQANEIVFEEAASASAPTCFAVAPVASAPGACFSTYNQTAEPLSPAFFVTDRSGRLLKRYWSQAANDWLWLDDGSPGVNLVGQPSEILNSPAAGTKFFVLGRDGRIYEHYFDASSSSWGWTPHGAPAGTSVASPPGAVMTAYNQASNDLPLSPAFFVVGANGLLYENVWNQAANSWQWQPHGAPPGELLMGKPGALLTETGLKFFVMGTKGELFERYWNPQSRSWNWTPHPAPSGVRFQLPPGAALSAYRQAGALRSPALFLAATNGEVWETYWSQAADNWLWQNLGAPSESAISGQPGAVFNSAGIGTKFFAAGTDGQIYAGTWDAASLKWSWTSQQGPPGGGAISPPSCALDSAATGIKYFISTADGHVWENYLDAATGSWGWTAHGPN